MESNITANQNFPLVMGTTLLNQQSKFRQNFESKQLRRFYLAVPYNF